MYIATNLKIGANKKKRVVYDNFDRPDNASLGNAITGQAWVGPCKIVSGKALPPDSASTYYTVIDAKISNIVMSADITYGNSNGEGLTFRYQDNNNYLAVRFAAGNSLALIKCVAGGVTVPVTYTPNPALVANGVYNLKVIAKNNKIDVYLNGNLVITATESQFQTNTLHGLRFSSSIGKIDNFKVEAI